jgi:hypothetical protein
MAIEYIRYNHGRHGELTKLQAVRSDPTKPDFIRKQADRGIVKIEAQLKDKKLQGLRERLIKAARAGDFVEQAKIQQQMRVHTGEDRETGLYEQT